MRSRKTTGLGPRGVRFLVCSALVVCAFGNSSKCTAQVRPAQQNAAERPVLLPPVSAVAPVSVIPWDDPLRSAEYQPWWSQPALKPLKRQSAPVPLDLDGVILR